MKKILYSLFLLVVLIPLGVRALENTDVSILNVEVNNNVISFNGAAGPESFAVMCKLYNSNEEEVAKYSVEVSNQTFAGNFIAPQIGNYTVSCANYSGGTIVSRPAVVESMTIYQVSFDARGGNLTSDVSVNVTHGETLEAPTDPVLDGKVFGGWCVDDTVTILFDFSTKITVGMTLYARWVDPTTQVQVIYGGDGAFKVEFDTDNYNDQGTMGAFVTQSQRYFVTTGNIVTLTAEVPEGQHFVGWYTTQEEEDSNNPGHTIWTNVDLLSEEQIYEFETEGLYINIKPVFAPNEGPEMHTITFNSKGGSYIEPIPVPDGGLLDVPSSPIKDGHVFVWWYEDETYEVSFDPSQEIHADLTLYAKWILEEEQREADQIQIWAAPGGRVAAQYTPSTPNVYDLVELSGTNYVENGEVVQYYINDQVTAKASPDEGFRFIGWKHANSENVIPEGMNQPPKCIGEVFSTEETYTYRPSVTVIEGDDSPIRYICADFEEDHEDEQNPGDQIGDDAEEQAYNLSDGAGNKISFIEGEGQNLALIVADISNLTDNELTIMGITREIYNNIKTTVLDETKKDGTLIKYLNIMVMNENSDEIDMSETPVTIKLLMTDDMEKYNSFKLVNFDINEQFEVIMKDVITLEVEEIDGVKYLVGNLPHLSAYALVGDTSATSIPKTYDGIMTWVITLVLSMFGFVALVIVNKISKRN